MGEQMDIRIATCTFCDGGCVLAAKIDGDEMQVGPVNPEVPAICNKAAMIDEYRLHPDRITKPLRRTGKRGENRWEETTWDEALDDIAARLKDVIAQYGPEAVAFAEMPLNTGFGGITRRFMNCLGAVNYTAPTQLCMGNTAQVHRAVYGWFASADWEHADCIVYLGQDRDQQKWPAEYLSLKAALARGATLVEIDPRTTQTAKLADYHLRIRYGTDAALLLGWINVIIEEGLYDHAFVEQQCIGFDQLKERVAEYTPEVVARTCGITADEVRQTAHVYAGANFAIIPWGVVGDMQTNSTSVLQAQCILRAICGYLNHGENVFGPAVGAVTNSQLADFGRLSPKQRAKQLGQQAHPLLTFKASDLYKDATARFGVPYEPDILGESCACAPSELFAAMRGEGPYPVKAIFCIGNNTVMSYAGQKGIVDAFMDQDLVVAYEHWMTPTAQLADYVLPGDMWAERDTLGPAFDVAPINVANRAFRPTVGECRNWYDVIKPLADRMGLAEDFPWKDACELYDWRLAPLGTTFAEVAKTVTRMNNPVAMGQFVTPSGKVELASSVLADLGFDPLPSFEAPSDPGAQKAAQEGGNPYPYIAFAGFREKGSYNTNYHQMPKLRAKDPEPQLYINPADADAEGLQEGQWCFVESAYGKVQLMAHLDDAQPQGSIRVPHGWWKPETQAGLDGDLSGACLYNDGMLMPDDNWNLDPVQGVPGLRGSIRVRVRAV